MSQQDFDVIVVGGGTAGSMAAVAAARMGARTCVVEAAGYLGGTCLALANITPFHNSRGEQVVGGLAQDLIDRIGAHGGTRENPHLPNLAGIGGSFTPVDPDAMKLALFELARLPEEARHRIQPRLDPRRPSVLDAHETRPAALHAVRLRVELAYARMTGIP